MMSMGLNIQRKSILTLFAFVSTLVTSCSKDETDVSTTPESLSGTTWKCTSGPYWEDDIEYFSLVFTSEKMVEIWTKFVDEVEQSNGTGTYIITNDQIFISYTYGSLSGTIDNDKMILTIDGDVYFFFKE